MMRPLAAATSTYLPLITPPSGEDCNSYSTPGLDWQTNSLTFLFLSMSSAWYSMLWTQSYPKRSSKLLKTLVFNGGPPYVRSYTATARGLELYGAFIPKSFAFSLYTLGLFHVLLSLLFVLFLSYLFLSANSTLLVVHWIFVRFSFSSSFYLAPHIIALSGLCVTLRQAAKEF